MKANQGRIECPANHLGRWLIGAAVLGCWLAVASAQEATNKTAELSELKQAAALVPRLEEPGIEPQFERLVRKLGPTFHEVPYNEKFGTNRFVKVVLNQKGGGFDGIRFKAPASGNRELVWVFGYPKTAALSNWYILDMKEPMEGFSSFVASDGPAGVPLDEFAPWGRLKADHVSVTQSLTGRRIKPGHEYVIWFRFEDAKPVDLFVALNLLNADQVPARVNLENILQCEKALGFLWE